MKKTLIALTILFVTVTLIFSNGKNETSSTVEKTTKGNEQSTEFTYPLTGDVKLTYFTRQAPTGVTNYSESPWYQEERENTGITVEYIHPPAKSDQEAFNILLATGDLPDIIKAPSGWNKFPGGPQLAIDDGYIIPLNDIINMYMPHYRAYLDSHPELEKYIMTDDGIHYQIPMIREDDTLTVYKGIMVRKDWLDELGLEIPETITEWENVLTQFKEKKGAVAPFTTAARSALFKDGEFIGAYGVKLDFFVQDGKVKYGPIEEGMKEYLTTMARWYKNGLLDPDIASIDRNTARSKVANGESGAYFSYGSDLGKAIDAGGDWVAAKYPSLKKGEVSMFGHKQYYATMDASVAISSMCENVEAAARFLDYAFSEEGIMLYNFGVEGVNYDMINGYPTYRKDDQGKLMVPSRLNGPGINDRRYIEQFYAKPQQYQAVITWGIHDELKYALPTLTPTTDEANELANIMSEVNTFMNESVVKFMLGYDSLDKYDSYVQTIKDYGIDRALEIYQAAYKRYQNR